jgi:hypothetical protein
MPDRFARTAATLDTPGGHMMLCLFVLFLGAGFCLAKVPKGEDLILMAAGALFGALRGKGAENHDIGSPQAGARIPAPPPDGGSKTESITTTVSSTDQKGD